MDYEILKKLDEQLDSQKRIEKHLQVLEAGLKLIFTVITVVGIFVSWYVLKRL